MPFCYKAFFEGKFPFPFPPKPPSCPSPHLNLSPWLSELPSTTIFFPLPLFPAHSFFFPGSISKEALEGAFSFPFPGNFYESWDSADAKISSFHILLFLPFRQFGVVNVLFSIHLKPPPENKSCALSRNRTIFSPSPFLCISTMFESPLLATQCQSRAWLFYESPLFSSPPHLAAGSFFPSSGRSPPPPPLCCGRCVFFWRWVFSLWC